MGRSWGAAGVRAEMMAWKTYPDVESELLNVHGLNHKISFVADARAAYSNVNGSTRSASRTTSTTTPTSSSAATSP